MTGPQSSSLRTAQGFETAPRAANVKPARSVNNLTLIYSTVVFLVISAFLLLHASRLLADGDIYWHLVVGEHILHTFSFPTVDEYSYTLAGAPWIAKEWLSQILFYAAYSMAGWFGVTFLTAAIAALASSILFAWLCRRVEPVVALTMTAVAFSLGMNTMIARPEIFFYLLLIVCVCGLVGAVENRKTPWWLPLLVALWANLHASFPIALVLAAFFALEAVASAAPGERVHTGIKWSLVLLASFAAMGATPYGYQPLLVSWMIVGAPEVNAIDEWKPMPFDLQGAYGAAFIAGSLAIVVAARAGWARSAPLLLCAGLMVRHVRFFALFAIVAAPVLATPIARLFPRFARHHSPPNASARKAAAAALAAASIATMVVLAFGPQAVHNPSVTPSAALEAARKVPVSGNVYNAYAFGGFLIFNGIKPFFDGRTELYFKGLLSKEKKAEEDKNDTAFLSLLNEYHVAWALLVPGTKAAEKLRRSTHWKEIFHDDDAEVFVKG